MDGDQPIEFLRTRILLQPHKFVERQFAPVRVVDFALFPTASRLMSRKWDVYKRVQDVIIATGLLCLTLLPLMLIALWIKLDSPGPVFFCQPRRGKDGRLFPCFKFRTMWHECADTEAREQSRKNDPRVTRAGGLLRKTSVDELPQLLNVLIGHMSMVGPRPHAIGTTVNGRPLVEVSDDYLRRYVVRPGITGWAQINGWRGILDSETKLLNRLEHDFHYIFNWKPWLDLKILIKTVACIWDHNAH